MWKRWRNRWTRQQFSEADYRREQTRILQRAPVPLFWMLGKTGSGKTSVVRFLTGADDAEIGNGFRPQTRYSRQYEFPDSESPLVRFLDTRGLGEKDYDATEDLRLFHQQANVILVTVRVMDHALAEIVESLKRIRPSHPDRPVLLILTCLHEGYPQQQHPVSDPFGDQAIPENLPEELRRSLRRQHERFAGLVDRVVPVDLTRPEEGFDDPEFGGKRLRTILLEVLPAAYRQTLLVLEDSMQSLDELKERRAMPYVISYSIMAATAAAVPLPWVDIPVVTALQAHLIYRLARQYDQPMGARRFMEMAAPIGGRLLMRQAVRGVLKFIPYVGIAANATLGYAYTYGLGKACCWYFGRVRSGNAPTPGELQQVWHAELARAAEMWRCEKKRAQGP
ncbi:MAG: GTP-binding DUF697 domain-containing protein [Planctomycetes bacterium]|nr:GTP-binding DUF697 domain-containing protein [Planctomycetota bacterium]